MKKRISMILFVLLSSLAITHSIGIGGEQDINAVHKWETWDSNLSVSQSIRGDTYLELPQNLNDECTTKFVLGTDKATLDAELAPYYGGGFCVNGGSFVNKTLGIGFGSVAKGALAFGGFSLAEGAGGWPAYGWAFVGNDEGVSVNLDSCTYKSGGTCVDAFPSAQIRGGIALKDCEYDAYGEACDINDAVICTGADNCYIAPGKIYFDGSDSSFVFVPNAITASTGLLTIKGNISSDADLTRRLGEPYNRYLEVHTNDTYTTRVYGVEGDTARYWGVSTLDLGMFGAYPTLEPYSDGPLGNIGAIHNGAVIYTNPLTGDTIDPSLVMIKIGVGSATMAYDSADGTFRFDGPVKIPNGFSEHFVHNDYKTSLNQNGNIFQIEANDTTMYTAFNMNVSAPEFIAGTDVYTPTIIGTKTGDIIHLAIDSDVIIDNQQADIPTTLQIKSDRDSGLTLQDDITNQSIVTYGGNLILAPDAGHLEVIPAVNDTNFGTAGYPWGNITGTYFIGDGSLLTNLPSSGGDFNDTGLLYQNGTRELTGNWDTGQYNITTPKINLTVAIGTAPIVTTSTTVCSNLNADLWDGYQFSDYLNQAVKTTSSVQFGNTITSQAVGSYTYGQLASRTLTLFVPYSGPSGYSASIQQSASGSGTLYISQDSSGSNGIAFSAKGTYLDFGSGSVGATFLYPDSNGTISLGKSSNEYDNVYAQQYYGKNDTIAAFDDYDDSELVRNIVPSSKDSKYFEMPSILYDKFNDTNIKKIVDKGVETEINETIETESLNIGKVIGLSYGTLKELIARDDELTSEIDWLTIENQRLKEKLDKICSENQLKGCT